MLSVSYFYAFFFRFWQVVAPPVCWWSSWILLSCSISSSFVLSSSFMPTFFCISFLNLLNKFWTVLVTTFQEANQILVLSNLSLTLRRCCLIVANVSKSFSPSLVSVLLLINLKFCCNSSFVFYICESQYFFVTHVHWLNFYAYYYLINWPRRCWVTTTCTYRRIIWLLTSTNNYTARQRWFQRSTLKC